MEPVSRSVLVVDDDAIFRRLIGEILSGWGHTMVGSVVSVFGGAIACPRGRRWQGRPPRPFPRCLS